MSKSWCQPGIPVTLRNSFPLHLHMSSGRNGSTVDTSPCKTGTPASFALEAQPGAPATNRKTFQVISQALGLHAFFHDLNRDSYLLFVSRCLRMYAYGAAGLILALFLSTKGGLGFTDVQVGQLLCFTLLGDACISLIITLYADNWGKRRMLLLGATMMAASGIVFALTKRPYFWVILTAATLGVISPSGNEVGPFQTLEQSILSELLTPQDRTSIFALYNLVGSLSTAMGSLTAGAAVSYLQSARGFALLSAYEAVFFEYAGIAALLFILFLCLSRRIESAHLQTVVESQESLAAAVAAAKARDSAAGRHTKQQQHDAGSADLEDPEAFLSDATAAAKAHAAARRADENFHVIATEEDVLDETEPILQAREEQREAGGSDEAAGRARQQHQQKHQQHKQQRKPTWGLSARSTKVVALLSALFATDSFAGGLITNTLLAYWFHITYDVDTAFIGQVLFVCNIISACSSLLSGWVASKIGLINTMVFTHLPSSIFTILIPLMPNLNLSLLMLYCRYSISQMDVAPRQSFVAGIVPKHERTAAMGITNVVKSLGAALGPLLTGYLATAGNFRYAFFLCGILKISYDLALLATFHAAKTDQH